MPDLNEPVILKDDVFTLTPKGQKELGGAGTVLTPFELEVLVLLDGASTAGQTATRVRNLRGEVVVDILRKLLHDGLIELVEAKGGSLDFVDFFDTKVPERPSAAETARAEQAAADTARLLQQQGYVVRIARRAAGKGIAAKSRPISILVIEDEQILANLLKLVLESAGYSVTTAMTKAEIAGAFGRPPVPELVLLDLMLPGVDGLDVLLKIRQHPALKSLPVVIMTAKTTRDAVLKGLASGADGYLTKPFEIPVLVEAVRAVLGLSADEGGVELGK